MESLLVFPDPPPPTVTSVLDARGYPWLSATTGDDASKREPDDGWSGAVICADEDPEGGLALCRSLRKRDLPLQPLLLLVTTTQLDDLELREDLFDDICVLPLRAGEVEARLRHLFWRTGRAPVPSSSSTASSFSTWRPTRPPSPAAPSTSPTWSTSC